MIVIKKGSVKMNGTAADLLAELSVAICSIRYDVLPQNGWAEDAAEESVRKAIKLGMTPPAEAPNKIKTTLLEVVQRIADMLKEE